MRNEDQQVLARVLDWARAKQSHHLISVLRTWGSAPRPPGAWMALREDGQVVGSVSGGCIEADLVDRLLHGRLGREACSVQSYGVSREEAQRFHLPCGGQLQVLIERMPSCALLQQLYDMLVARQCCVREVDVQTGAVVLRPAREDEDTCFDGRHYRARFGPAFRLLLIGAGSLSQRVAELALALDYRVIVCDPRQEYMAQWPLDAVQCLRCMPDDAVLELKPDAHTAVLALTHDPKLDDLALIDALQSRALYVGALGSRANGDKKRERMLLFGVSPAQAARLHCPVGLDLGARMPEEIALAIMAELTAVRHAAPILRHVGQH